MRLLLDTNVLIAAFISRGVCHELLAYCVYNHQLITSRALLQEFQEKLVSKFNFTQSETRDAVLLLESRFEIVEPATLDKPVSRDPDDDLVLAAALGGNCDCMISGDKDLLVLKHYRQVPILSPAEFWKFESESNRR
jgi:putative PIN family toxin of toxin-antitoxin system